MIQYPPIVEQQQRIYDAVYPMACEACGRREEEHRPRTLSDNRTVALGAYCACGAFKGFVPASPRETYRLSLRTTKACLPPESLRPKAPVVQTHVAAIAEVLEREPLTREPPPPPPPPQSPMAPDERYRFMQRAAALGADEHRLRCDLAVLGEELECCTRRSARAVIRELEAESERTCTAGPCPTQAGVEP